MKSKILGVTDTAVKLGCSPERVRQLEREGKLPAERMSRGQRMFRIEDVEQLAIEREQQRRERAAQ